MRNEQHHTNRTEGTGEWVKLSETAHRLGIKRNAIYAYAAKGAIEITIGRGQSIEIPIARVGTMYRVRATALAAAEAALAGMELTVHMRTPEAQGPADDQ